MAEYSVIEIGIHLVDAERFFVRACEGDCAIEHAVYGLDALLRASAYPTSIAAEFPRQASDLVDLLFVVTLKLSEAATRYVSRELIELAMAAASALVTNAPDDILRDDHRMYVALLRYELAAAVCRREIARRGDPFARSIAVRKAAAAPHDHRLQ